MMCFVVVLRLSLDTSVPYKSLKVFSALIAKRLVPEFVFSSASYNFKILGNTCSLVFYIIYTIVMSGC